MRSEELTERMRLLLQAERAGDRVQLELGPYSMLMLIGTVQWAMKQPEITKHDDDTQVYAHALAQLRAACANYPDAQALLDTQG